MYNPNKMHYGGQSGSPFIHPLNPGSAYDAGERLNRQTQNLQGQAMPVLAGRYAAFINNV